MKLEIILLALQTATFLSEGLQEEKFAYCESYNATACGKENKEDCYTQEKCGIITADRHNHCFTLWKHNPDSDVSEVKMKGCFSNIKECYGKSYCTEKNVGSNDVLYFCCCNGNMCNQNFTYENILKKPDGIPIDDLEFNTHFTRAQWEILIPMLVALSTFIAISIFIFMAYLYSRRSKSGKTEISNVESGQSQVITETQSQPSIPQLESVNETLHELEDKLTDALSVDTELIEKKVSGCYGEIWKARSRTTGETVAVKIFRKPEKKYWYNEFNVLCIPGMIREDLLRFIGACRVGDGPKTELWLLTDYYDEGSLYDYLRVNTITTEELFDTTMSILRGLKYLHEEIGEPVHANYKPAVVHLDFKSQKVLVKRINPIRVCISDFTLALIVHENGRYVKPFARVGTPRYMSPEVINSAITYRKNVILSIDVYAFALVLWELVSRCKIGKSPVSDHQLAFQSEVGLNASIKEMHDCVVRRNLRPKIKRRWRKHRGIAEMCSIMEQCWEMDADTRISSSTAYVRIKPFAKSFKTTSRI